MGIIEKIIEEAKTISKKIVLPETEDERVLKAAEQILQKGIAKVILVGKEEIVKSDAKKLGLNIAEATIVDPNKCEKMDVYVDELVKLREKKGMTKEKALEILANEPRYFGAMMVRMGDADGMVAGSNSPTADVIRASIHVIGAAKGVKTISSSFMMVMPDTTYGDNGILFYTDCGVVPAPTSEQLADIATSASWLGRKLAGIEPKVAMLSFSTKGSAKHPSADKVIEAVEILKNRDVDFEFDGELQADAAIVPAIGAKKAPGSNVAGKANILVFPDLGAGNIAYKLTQRLANAGAYGPLLQGLNKPVNDLSRGCSVEDIVNVTAITAVEAK